MSGVRLSPYGFAVEPNITTRAESCLNIMQLRNCNAKSRFLAKPEGLSCAPESVIVSVHGDKTAIGHLITMRLPKEVVRTCAQKEHAQRQKKTMNQRVMLLLTD